MFIIQIWRSIMLIYLIILPVNKQVLDSCFQIYIDILYSYIFQKIGIFSIFVRFDFILWQGQATGTASPTASPTLQFPPLLAPTTFSDSDLSLLSWLHSIPPDTFACPFEQRTLNVDVERLDKPSLEASWTEQLLITPIKPKVFPHSAIPYNRQKATDIMSRSLNPNMDGLALRNSMMASSGDASLMSKSIASFHLTGKKTMNTSVDRLFDADNVFTGSAYGDLPTIIEKDMSSVSLNKECSGGSNLKDSSKRPSSDSLNKAYYEKNENDSSKDDLQSPLSRSHSPQPLTPQNSSQPPPNLSHHPLHHNISAPLQPPQQHPKHNVALPPLPSGGKQHSPHQPYPPQQQQQQHQRSPYHPQQHQQPYNTPSFNNNNINSSGAHESTELFNIYQRRQQQQQPPPAYHNNNANANRWVNLLTVVWFFFFFEGLNFQETLFEKLQY